MIAREGAMGGGLGWPSSWTVPTDYVRVVCVCVMDMRVWGKAAVAAGGRANRRLQRESWTIAAGAVGKHARLVRALLPPDSQAKLCFPGLAGQARHTHFLSLCAFRLRIGR